MIDGNHANYSATFGFAYQNRKFTPWLAQEKNLASFGLVIGIELEFDGKVAANEVNVSEGGRAILSKESASIM